MLRYIGKGAWLPGIPARNMSDKEAAKYDINCLLASGLYEIDRPRKQPKEKRRWVELADEHEEYN